MARLFFIPVGAAAALALTISGCGGLGGGDSLFDSGSSGAGGAPSSTSSTTGSLAATTSTTGATSASATSSSAATTSASATSGATASSAASTGTGVVDQTLPCGDTTCPFGQLNACCWSKFAMPMASGACVDAPVDSDGCKTFVASDGLQARLECQRSAQCDQGKCCGHRTFFNGQNFFYDLVSCLDTCDPADVTLCDPANPADVCPMIQTQGGPVQGVCKQSGSLPPGYFVCSAPG
jgi:hypothetical protein